MISRPLDLASRLRSEPRTFDWLHFVNGGFIVLFFTVFGSPFVLAPGLPLDFRLPVVPGAEAAALAPTSVIRITDAGQIFAPDGIRTVEQLPEWLRTEALKAKDPVLLIIAGSGVRISLVTEVYNAARAAGFSAVTSAAVEPAEGVAK